MGEPRTGFAFLEHTADVGIRAWGPSPREAFEQAGIGLAALMGLTARSPGRATQFHVDGVDAGGLLVALLDELVFRLETAEGEGLASLRITRLNPTSLQATVELAPMRDPVEGLVVKAATYHQLEVAERPEGATEIRVFLDV